MALAGDDHQVTCSGHFHCEFNGLSAVANAPVVLPFPAPHPLAAGCDLSRDGVQVLGARILSGDDHAVGQLAGDLPHHRPLGHVP